MRAVVQRVTEARVEVDGTVVGSIGPGFLVLVGVQSDDSGADQEYLADKIANLRVFEDEAGKMNLSLLEAGGEALMVSQFTLYGDARKGRRPSFSEAAGGEIARPIFDSLCERVQAYGIRVAKGAFGEMMQVHLVNDGPVTILLDSRRGF